MNKRIKVIFACAMLSLLLSGCAKNFSKADEDTSSCITPNILSTSNLGEENMMSDLIDRQAAIDALKAEGRNVDSRYLESEHIIHESDAVEAIAMLPSAQPETCEGCKHLSKWENEVEYGYSSPCTRCKRRVEDYYER